MVLHSIAARFCCALVAVIGQCQAVDVNRTPASGPPLPTHHLQLILGRALTDLDYRDLLYLDPGKALEGYVLTDQEVRALYGLPREKLDGLAQELQARLSPAAGGFDQGL
jgi:hypothetical protein